MRIIIIAAILLLSVLSGVAVSAEPYHVTPDAVANRCAGEASFAVVECSCSVKNRILAGWSEAKVLSAYLAPDSTATPEQIKAAGDVLSGVTFCRSDIYFMFGFGDIKALGLEDVEPTLKLAHNGQEVWFYEQFYKKRQ